MTEISRASRWSSTLARLSTLTVMAFIMLVTPAAASNPFAADLSVPGETIDLLTDANVRIDGAAEGDTAGYSVSDAGDVNGDGTPDVIIGALSTDKRRRLSYGSAYVVYGSATPATIDLKDLDSKEGFLIEGAAEYDQAGISVSGAGDVNGDGRDDVILGAINADYNDRYNAGSAYVIYGSASPETINLRRLGRRDGFRIGGADDNDNVGRSVSAAGDVNGDGRDDVIVGASNAGNNDRDWSGSAYVIYGKKSIEAIDLRILRIEEGFRIDGGYWYDSAGHSVSGAGDVNGDGRDDVIIGAYGADNNGRSNSGSAYVIYGSASPTTIDLRNDLDNEKGFRIDGAAESDYAGGYTVSDAGDVNGDGIDDVITGAYSADNNGRNKSGSAYVIYGSTSPATIDLERLGNEEGFRIDGAAANDHAGGSTSGAGDVNGDGIDDVIVGATGAGGDYSGSAYVIYGSMSPVTIDLERLGNEEGFRIDGAAAEDSTGNSVSGAGDLTGDGRPDVIVGASRADNNGRYDSGSAYVVYSPGPEVITVTE